MKWSRHKHLQNTPAIAFLNFLIAFQLQVKEELLPIGEKIWKELETTVKAVKMITEREELLGNNPVIKRLYDYRRPHTDPLNILQVHAVFTPVLNPQKGCANSHHKFTSQLRITNSHRKFASQNFASLIHITDSNDKFTFMHRNFF